MAFNTEGVVVDGTFSVAFAFYNQSTGGGLPLWSETQNVTFDGGAFSAVIGDGTSFPSDLFDEDSLFLEIEIDGDELSPRIAISSAPWAEQANKAVAISSLGDLVITPSAIASGAVTTEDILDATILNADISDSASIAWSKISKSGASASDLSAASASHTHAASDLTGSATDAMVSNTLTASIFIGSGSATNAVDLATAEVAGILPLANLADGNTTTHFLFAGGGGGDPAYRAITDADIPNTIVAGTTASAAALAANPTNCVAGQTMKGVEADGDAETCTAIEIESPHTALTRRFGYAVPASTTSTAFSSFGVAAGTALFSSGTATARPALSGANRMYIEYQSALNQNSLGGLNSTSFVHLHALHRPKIMAVIRTSNSLSNQRVCIGTGNAAYERNPLSIAQTAMGTGTMYVSTSYETSVNANWLCCSGAGSNHSCIDTGVAVTADTEYTVTTDWSVNGTLTCTVNGTSTNKTTDLDSTSTTGMGILVALANPGNGTQAIINIAKVMIEQN